MIERQNKERLKQLYCTSKYSVCSEEGGSNPQSQTALDSQAHLGTVRCSLLQHQIFKHSSKPQNPSGYGIILEEVRRKGCEVQREILRSFIPRSFLPFGVRNPYPFRQECPSQPEVTHFVEIVAT